MCSASMQGRQLAKLSAAATMCFSVLSSQTVRQRDTQALAYHHIQTPSPHTVGVEVNTEFFLEFLTEFLFQLKLEIAA